MKSLMLLRGFVKTHSMVSKPIFVSRNLPQLQTTWAFRRGFSETKIKHPSVSKSYTQSPHPTIPHSDTVMSLLLSGKVRDAEQALFRLSPTDGEQVSIRTISKLLKANSVLWGPNIVVPTLEKYMNFIAQHKIEVNHIFFGTIFSFLLKSRRYEDALQMFRTYLPKFNLPPNELLYHMFLDYLLASDKVAQALKMFTEMRQVTGATARAYQAVIVRLIDTDYLREAKVLITEMEKDGFEKDVVIYTSLIKYYGIRGKFDMADIFVKEMRSNGIQPSFRTYGSLLEMYEKRREIEKSKEIVAEMIKNEIVFDWRIYTNLLTLYSRTKEWNLVAEYFKQAIDRGEYTPNTIQLALKIGILNDNLPFVEFVCDSWTNVDIEVLNSDHIAATIVYLAHKNFNKALDLSKWLFTKKQLPFGATVSALEKSAGKNPTIAKLSLKLKELKVTNNINVLKDLYKV